MSSDEDEGGTNHRSTDNPRRLTPEERSRQYKSGSIVRIKLKNFLTYADVEFKPGPRLNVVIGPNGTGKSTILCAICLGLGGQPPLLGRADDARTFIKNDEEIAEIEIELAPSFNSRERHIIKRIIDRNKGAEKGRGVAASSYFINNTPSKLKHVQKLVADTYRISIDNLCTFLPQDRVGSFSGFDSKMLLEETEKSVSGTQHLYESHMALISLEKEILESDSNLQSMEDKAARLQSEVDELEKMKELMEERKQYQKQLKLLRQKLAWVKFDTKRDQAVATKENKKKLKNDLKNANAGIAPIKEQIERILQELNRNNQRKSQLMRSMNNAKKTMETNLTFFEKYQDEIENNQSHLNSIDANHRRAKLKVEECLKKVQDHESILGTFPPQEELKEAHREAHEAQRAIREQLKVVKNEVVQDQYAFKEKKNKLDQVRYQYDQMKDEKARRNEMIFSREKALHQAYKWIDSNRKMFRRQVWGPIVCEITTNDNETSNCLEQHVRNNVLKSFVVECREDYNLLYREVREKARIPVNIQVVNHGKLDPVRRRYSEHKMQVLKQEHGVQGYLDECFSAPDPILQALRNTSNVHSVLMGNEQTTDSLNRKQLMNYLNQKENGQGLQASCIFATDRRQIFKYTSTVSRYSGKASLSVDEISPAQMLRPGVPQELKDQTIRQMEELQMEMDRIQPALQEKDEKYQSLQSKGQEAALRTKDAQKGMQELAECKRRVESSKRKLREAEKDASKDNGREKANLKNTLRKNVDKCLTSLETASTKNDQYLTLSTEFSGIELAEEGKRQKHDALVERKYDMEVQSQEIEQAYNAICHQFNREKEELAQLKMIAMDIAPIADEHGNELPLKEQLNDLPESITEIDVAIEDTTDRINGIHDNPDAMRRYEAQKRELEEVKERLGNMKESKEAQKQALDSKRGPWESALDNITTKVNVLFSKYMEELGCAGEVRLSKGDHNRGAQEHLGNFKEWGVEIRVKFREKSDLQVLSAQVHSGGERSVSTIMYLMAMQNLMISPFRCVDEINQGLDERNERLVFKRIVQNSTKPPENVNDPTSHCGQYFLITPKLLPNLTDMENENVTVHCIFNGPFNFKHYGDWDIDRFLESKKRKIHDDNGRQKRVKVDES